MLEDLGAVPLGRRQEGRRSATKIAQEIWKILVDEQFGIGTVGQSPAFMGVRIVRTSWATSPTRQINAQHARTPSSSHPATFFFKS